MKKFLLTSIIIFFSVFSYAQQKEVIWDFPIKPGTEKWAKLKTEKERFDAMQIPKDILSQMSTKELVKGKSMFESSSFYLYHGI